MRRTTAVRVVSPLTVDPMRLRFSPNAREVLSFVFRVSENSMDIVRVQRTAMCRQSMMIRYINKNKYLPHRGSLEHDHNSSRRSDRMRLERE